MARAKIPRWVAPGTPIPDLSRREPSRQANTSILIIPEGDNEAAYFRNLVREVRAPTVQVDASRGVPMTLVERGLEIQARRQRSVSRGEPPDFDAVWCVFDGGDDHPRFPEAVGLAVDNGIRVACSYPCFETWLLLHMRELTTSPLQRDEAKQILRDGFVPGYGKTVKVCPYSTLAGRSHVAVDRAKKLSQQHAEHGGVPNPSSDVYKLVEQIYSVGASLRLS